MKKLNTIIWTLVKWALVAIVVIYGVFFFILFYTSTWLDLEKKMWPKVSAVVEETTVIRLYEGEEGEDYCPRSTVKYQLNGAPHTAILWFDCGFTKDSARQAAEQWPRGKELQVHASPANTNTVYLVGFSLRMYGFFFLFKGCLFFLIAYHLWKLTPMDLKSRMLWWK